MCGARMPTCACHGASVSRVNNIGYHRIFDPVRDARTPTALERSQLPPHHGGYGPFELRVLILLSLFASNATVLPAFGVARAEPWRWVSHMLCCRSGSRGFTVQANASLARASVSRMNMPRKGPNSGTYLLWPAGEQKDRSPREDTRQRVQNGFQAVDGALLTL